MSDNIDLDTSWIKEAIEQTKKKETSKKECPYCHKEFVKLYQHIKTCSEKPGEKSISVMTKNQKLDLEIKEMKIQLEESKQAIRDLVNKVRELEHHELTEENIISYFRTVKYAKKYELYRAFTPHNTREIDKIVKKLYQEGTLRRNQNYWYSLNPQFKKESEK